MTVPSAASWGRDDRSEVAALALAPSWVLVVPKSRQSLFFVSPATQLLSGVGEPQRCGLARSQGLCRGPPEVPRGAGCRMGLGGAQLGLSFH